MSNEEYLIVSYFTAGVAVLILATATYGWLRPSLEQLADRIIPGPLASMLKRLFYLGMLLPALTGFLSVSFKDCSTDTYQEVVEHRSYLVLKNQEQLSAALAYIAWALLIWGLLVFAGLVATRMREARSPEGNPIEFDR